jgi:hypothetical protein
MHASTLTPEGHGPIFPSMDDPTLLRKCIDLFGGTAIDFAGELTRDPRTVRRWLAGEEAESGRPIPTIVREQLLRWLKNPPDHWKGRPALTKERMTKARQELKRIKEMGHAVTTRERVEALAEFQLTNTELAKLLGVGRERIRQLRAAVAMAPAGA